MPAYDAFLLLSFGGPEGPDDVLPFLENVTRGRGVPAERLAEVAEHYYAGGGVSPINGQCRDLLAAIGAAARHATCPLYWGNRNWHPFLDDTVRRMAADGVRHAIAFVTSAYSSYSACRQYLDDIDRGGRRGRARARRGSTRSARTSTTRASSSRSRPAPRRRCARLPAGRRRRRPAGVHRAQRPGRHGRRQRQRVGRAPWSRCPGGRYAAELREASRLISERMRGGSLRLDLVFQSRSGPPSVPWLEPDVNDHLAGWPRRSRRQPLPAAVGGACRSGSSATTWRSCTTWTWRRRETAASLGLAVRAGGGARLDRRGSRAMVRELVAERTAGARRWPSAASALGAFAGGGGRLPGRLLPVRAPVPAGAPS